MNKAIEQSFNINFKYNVFFTKNLFNINNSILLNLIKSDNDIKKKAIVIIDKGVYDNHKYITNNIKEYFNKYNNFLDLRLDPIILSGGEIVKNDFLYIKKIYKIVKEQKICRHSFIIVIGGGSLLDVIGYAASTAHRGINLIRIPTTVLSQNDSGVGVKNGINYFNNKNFIGTFSPPYAVINDFNFLYTLENKYWIGGISEAIKVALIKDKDFFDFLFNNIDNFLNRENYSMEVLIYRCAKLHINHIANGDPFELYSSRPLDFGHWFAHKLESFTNYKITHGEAVAIGIVIDSLYSYFIGKLSKEELDKIITIFVKLKFILFINEMNISVDILYNIINQGLSDFKEHLGGKLTIMILEKIGYGINVNNMNVELIYKSIMYLKNLKYEDYLK